MVGLDIQRMVHRSHTHSLSSAVACDNLASSRPFDQRSQSIFSILLKGNITGTQVHASASIRRPGPRIRTPVLLNLWLVDYQQSCISTREPLGQQEIIFLLFRFPFQFQFNCTNCVKLSPLCMQLQPSSTLELLPNLRKSCDMCGAECSSCGCRGTFAIDVPLRLLIQDDNTLQLFTHDDH